MKTIGVLGLTSRVILKTYSILNELASEFYGKNASAELMIETLSFDGNVTNQYSKEELTKLVSQSLKNIENGGADFIIMVSNSLHNYYKEASKSVTIPVIHIIDSVQEVLSKENLKKVALITSEKVDLYNFYAHELKNIELIIPDNEDDKQFIDDVIYKELSEGIHNIDSLKRIKSIIDKMIEKGAEALILGSSNFTYFINEEDVSIPIIDARLEQMKIAFELAVAE